MIVADTIIIDKINELEQEMKNSGLWLKEIPNWVNYFEGKLFVDGKDFAQWLQYVFIPNHKKKIEHLPTIIDKKLIVPQVMKYFGSDIVNGKLLKILIEIDSLL